MGKYLTELRLLLITMLFHLMCMCSVRTP